MSDGIRNTARIHMPEGFALVDALVYVLYSLAPLAFAVLSQRAKRPETKIWNCAGHKHGNTYALHTDTKKASKLNNGGHFHDLSAKALFRAVRRKPNLSAP